MQIRIPLLQDSCNSFPEDCFLEVEPRGSNSRIMLGLECPERTVEVSLAQMEIALQALAKVSPVPSDNAPSFLYFENTEGGLETHQIRTKNDLFVLRGWMKEDVQEQDVHLLRWMDIAKVGNTFEHRLGYMVRVSH